MTTAHSAWSIDVPEIPIEFLDAWLLIEDQLAGSDWHVRLVNVDRDQKNKPRPSYFSVAVRQRPRPTGVDGVDDGKEGASFSDLSTVRSMGTGISRHVVGFDTEFTYSNSVPTERVIDSYQFACTLPGDDTMLVEVVILPMHRNRILIEDALYIVSLAAGLHRINRSGELIDPRGVLMKDVRVNDSKGEFDYGASRDEAAKFGIPLVLAGHYGNADFSTFQHPPVQRSGGEKFHDILRMLTSASGGLVSLRPTRFFRRSGKGSNSDRWLPFSVTVRDTKAQTAEGHKTLEALGKVCGVPKLDVGENISNMSGLRRRELLKFLEYGSNDSVIILEYLSLLWGLNQLPPVTISGAGATAMRDGVMNYMGFDETPEFLMSFRGLVKQTLPQAGVEDDSLAYYAVRSLTHVDGDANQAHTAWKRAFHGGWNGCLAPGYHPYPTYDHDIQSAYPSAMASIFDVDYVGGCIEKVVKDRELTLEDFPQGPVTPLVTWASWEFPEDVVAPCLPVVVGDSVIYPRRSTGAGAGQGDDVVHYEGKHGAWCAGPELYLAVKLGARVTVQHGYRMRILEGLDGGPSMSLRSALKQMVDDRATAKRIFGEGSLEEQTIKIATNSAYGKLAQDVSERNGWDAWEEHMQNIGGSSVTSPYHASMTTSLVRALLLAMANTIDILSVTTDGFITAVEDIEDYDCFGLADVFREARTALSGDSTVWEVKHHQDDLVNFSTRANSSLLEHGVLAKGGLKTPSDIERESLEEREWFRNQGLSREGKIPNPYTSFTSFRELSRSKNRVDFHAVERAREVSSLDFDMKRQPVESTLRVDIVDGHDLAGFETRPWDTILDYQRARDISKHMQLVRAGTEGDDRPSGCLRTEEDWRNWFKRVNASERRRIRTARAELLKEVVAAHKFGLVTVDVLDSSLSVDEKVTWLSSLGHGKFTKAQWDNMSKKDRRATVIRGIDIDAIRLVVDELNAGEVDEF